MARFGDELREAREARAVSLHEISDRTKVSVRHLTALEAEDYGAMPGGVFLKGVFRSYLGELQLNEQEWMPRFEESLHRRGLDTGPDHTKLAEFAQAVHRSRVTELPRSRARWMGVLALLLALAIAGFFAWRFVIRPRLAPPADPPVPSLSPGVPMRTPDDSPNPPAPHSLLQHWIKPFAHR